MPGGADLGRLRWQCRRGMLENDLVLERFLELHGEALEGEKLTAFKRLLALGDGELWDVVCGRSVPADAAEAQVALLLASCTPGRIGD
jgi:antitoxin CptB